MPSKIKTKRERVKFASDNVAGACPEVLDAIIKANDGDSAPYGNDNWSKILQEKFSNSYKDIENKKFEDVTKYINYLKENPS